jgi:hypothetical protein
VIEAYGEAAMLPHSKDTGEDLLRHFGRVHLLTWGEAVVTRPTDQRRLAIFIFVYLTEVAQEGDATTFGPFSELKEARELATRDITLQRVSKLINKNSELRRVR